MEEKTVLSESDFYEKLLQLGITREEVDQMTEDFRKLGLLVEIDGQVHEGVISGTSVDQPPGSVLNARTRKFWYKEID